MHKKKDRHGHERFMFEAKKIIKAECPTFEAKNKVLTTDGEFIGLNEEWKNTEQAVCWNHQEQNVHRKASVDLKMSAEHCQQVNQDVQRFLRHQTKEAYVQDRDATLANGEHWNTEKGQRLKAYYLKNKDELFQTHSCRFALEQKGLRNVENGITNNASETLNSQMRHLKRRGEEELTTDDLVLRLHRFEHQLNSEIDAANYGVGEYRLKEGYEHLQLWGKGILRSLDCSKESGGCPRRLRTTPICKSIISCRKEPNDCPNTRKAKACLRIQERNFITGIKYQRYYKPVRGSKGTTGQWDGNPQAHVRRRPGK